MCLGGKNNLSIQENVVGIFALNLLQNPSAFKLKLLAIGPLVMPSLPCRGSNIWAVGAFQGLLKDANNYDLPNSMAGHNLLVRTGHHLEKFTQRTISLCSLIMLTIWLSVYG